MRSVAVVVALCGLLHAQTFKSGVEQVAVPVTIRSELNEPLIDLRPDDFRVFDDGRPVSITAFGKVRQPVHVVLLLDTSRSVMESLPEVKRCCDCRHRATRCGRFRVEMQRRAVFVVSDGVDTSSSVSARMVIQRAAEKNAAVYAVGVNSRYLERGRSVARGPDATLRQIAEDTGGRYVHAGIGERLPTVLASMMDELHQQYILGFTPVQADGRVHSLVVTTRRPSVRIRARKYYLAPVSAR